MLYIYINIECKINETVSKEMGKKYKTLDAKVEKLELNTKMKPY
jgi:hypothetical protein